MTFVRGFYQPITTGSKILWTWWTVFLLISPIWASELFYAVNLPWLLYTVIILALGLVLHLRRRIYLSDHELIISFLGKKADQSFDLRDRSHWLLQGRRLTIWREGIASRYLISFAFARQLKKESTS
ncbi:hypothetical protein PT274_02235 [Leuconostocaceae bacterium ESL0958]|nr:hypothetical protein [Leuconostocaceae bacterium ESL0958]